MTKMKDFISFLLDKLRDLNQSIIRAWFRLLKAMVYRFYRLLNRLTGGILGIVVTAVRRFLQLHAFDEAASIGFYSLFSLFPMLIFLVIFGSFVLEEQQVYDFVITWLGNLSITATDFVQENLLLLIAQRETAGLTAIIGLLWSGTGAFSALARSVNRAWPNATPRNFFKGRFVAIWMMIVLGILLILALLATTVLSILSLIDAFSVGMEWINTHLVSETRAYMLSLFFIFISFFSLYHWVPTVDVRPIEAVWGALVATFGWRWAISIFTWVLSSGLTNLQVLYGTLGTVIALMIWIYISSAIALFGAHLSAAIAIHHRL